MHFDPIELVIGGLILVAAGESLWLHTHANPDHALLWQAWRKGQISLFGHLRARRELKHRTVHDVLLRRARS